MVEVMYERDKWKSYHPCWDVRIIQDQYQSESYQPSAVHFSDGFDENKGKHERYQPEGPVRR